VLGADIAVAYCVSADAQIDGVTSGVYVDARLRRPRDSQVSGTAEHHLDVHYRALDVDSVEEFRRLWHGDGGQHTDDAQRNGELDYRERAALLRISSLT